jgi:hypothetical protein
LRLLGALTAAGASAACTSQKSLEPEGKFLFNNAIYAKVVDDQGRLVTYSKQYVVDGKPMGTLEISKYEYDGALRSVIKSKRYVDDISSSGGEGGEGGEGGGGDD